MEKKQNKNCFNRMDELDSAEMAHGDEIIHC